MKDYLKGHVWEWLLCVLMSAALLTTFAQGFYIPDRVADSFPLAAVVSAVILFLLFLAGYNRIGMILFPICLVAAAVLGFLLMRANSIDIVDQEGSGTSVYIYCFAAIIIPVITYLLSRGRIGICVLFVLGACLFGVIDYLDYDMAVWCCACFVCCAPALFALRLYRAKSRKGSAFSPEFSKLFRTAILAGVVSLLLASGVYAAIIRPLSPPTASIHLVTKYMRWEILQKTGIADSYVIPDELLAANYAKQTTTSSRQKEQEQEENGEESEASGEDENTDNQTEKDGTESSLGAESGGGSGEEKKYSAVSFLHSVMKKIPWIIILICIAAVAIPLLKNYLWRKKIKQAKALPAKERAILLCRYYLVRFRRLGFGRSPWQTEREYAQSLGNTLGNYMEGTISLAELMEIYIRARYGGQEPTGEEDTRLMEFYPVFRRNYRKKKGTVNYLLKYFKL